MKYKNTVRIKRTVSFAAAVAMAVSAVPIIPAYAETGTKSYVYDKYKIDYTVNSKWVGKQNVSVTLTNTSDEPILNWALGYDAQGDINDIWNGYVFYQNGEPQWTNSNQTGSDLFIFYSGKANFGIVILI